jgi:5-methylcytosine-specific restriction endonuclease McrA
VEADGPRKRRNGQGSIYFQTRTQSWVAAYVSKATGKRRTKSSIDWRVVEEWLDKSVALSVRPRAAYRLTVLTRRVRAELWVTRILDQAAVEQWLPAKTARVIVSQLAPRRLRDNIFGPCVYCGSWEAGTVDHVIPQVRGGGSEVDNLVSACIRCNSRKNDRTPEEWAS